MKTIPLAASAALILLSGCMTTSEPGSLDKTRNGALIGAGVGLLSQVIAGNSTNSKIKGAVVGAAAGAGLGYFLDRQEADLRDRMASSGATIHNTGEELIVTLPEGITFDSDSAHVRASSAAHLSELSQSLKTYPDSTVDVIGHTDNTGAEAYNQALSARRAHAVNDLLLAHGIAFDRTRAFGRGELEPVASNESESGRAQNRRVEVIIRPEA